MKLTHAQYRPGSLLTTLHRDFEELTNLFQNADQATSLSEWTPRVDIKEEAKQYVVLADIPGIDPKNVSIVMDNNVLTIRGERNFEQTTEKENFARIERSYGSFYRQFTLPSMVDSNAISAKYKDGVLIVAIPKLSTAVSKNIAIKVEH